MTQFEAYTEINAGLRTYLLNCPQVSAIIGTKLFYPFVPSDMNQNEKAPHASFRRAGGVAGEYRYLFTIRAQDGATLEQLRRAMLHALLESTISLPNDENVVFARSEESYDNVDENTGMIESYFYVTIELLEA